MRIRVGRGPTGRAVAEGLVVEVEDLFADPALREWWEPARELGFVSLIALPLRLRGKVAGALTFYFDAPHSFDTEERRLLALVADQLAATAERAHLIEDLQDSNRNLTRRNEDLGDRVRDAEYGRRLRTEFLANVSHELRTPLTSILGYTHLLASGHLDGPAASDALAKIERSASALLGLINDLIDLSQLKLGRVSLELAEEHAVALAQRAIESAGPIPPELTLDLHAPDGELPITTDGAKVVKLLGNLLSNALKFTSEGSVTVTVRQEPALGEQGARVAWDVRDTGIGIRREDLEAIFDEFRQVDGSSTRLYGGTGLGLAMSRRIARLLGGDVSVESQPGIGSCFTLRLPTRLRLDAAIPEAEG